ncbi:MAG: methyltransferase, TIGR04325 family [Candidatus Eisenbacteria bacterium]
MDWKLAARDLLPPALRRGLRALRAGQGARFAGPYGSWEAAAAAATGYDAAEILGKVRAAALAVKRGEAVFERDSVRFMKPEPPVELLAVLLRSAAAHSGRVSVLDFGGSLGSTYFQCRPFLTGIASLRWSVVEQQAFVACGRREFESDELLFFDTIEEAARAEPARIAVLSSVLQYLPDPAAIARRITDAQPDAILIDRTPVHDRPDDSIVVQHVAPAIYRASYPFRIFGRDRLPMLFGGRYLPAATLPDTPFDALERQHGARYIGMVLEPGT